MRVEYPVALDRDYAVWRAFDNNYWPAVYIADAEGRIRHHHFGEGGYEECERVIQLLLREAGRDGVADDLVSVADEGFEAQADWANLESPETYLGYEQGAELRVAPTAPSSTSRHDFAAGAAGAEPVGAVRRLDGRAAGERAERGRGAARVPLPRPRRQSRHGPAGDEARRCRSACSSTASLPATRTGSTSTSRATERSTQQRLHQLIREPGRSATARSRSPSSPRASRPTVHLRLGPPGQPLAGFRQHGESRVSSRHERGRGLRRPRNAERGVVQRTPSSSSGSQYFETPYMTTDASALKNPWPTPGGMTIARGSAASSIATSARPSVGEPMRRSTAATSTSRRTGAMKSACALCQCTPRSDPGGS